MRKKWLISLFILLNLATITYSNLPEGVAERAGKWPGLRLLGLADEFYATLAGLSPRWRLVSTIPHETYTLTARLEYGEKVSRVVPLPTQGERSGAQTFLFDTKEPLLYRALLTAPPIRASYAAYLGRQYPGDGNSSATSLLYELRMRPILAPFDSGRSGQHWGKEIVQQERIRLGAQP